ncbi:MAG: trigger factor [Candidatus Dependentiae bacterium]
MKQISQNQNQPLYDFALDFQFNQVRPTCATLSIIIPKECVNKFFLQAAHDQKQALHTIGFNKGEVPIEYIEQNFMFSLIDHVQEFLFKYFVIPFLYKELRSRKILIAGEPRLKDIRVKYNSDGAFDFELSTFENIPLLEWRYFPFKAPKRKKYKDLDRQVDSFIKDEKEALKNFDEQDIVHINDWVQFLIKPLDNDGLPFFNHEPLMLWLKMGDEDADEELRSIFMKRKKGEIFNSQSRGLQHFFGHQFETNYIFAIEIIDILHDSYFCFELFKKQFKLKTNKEMLQKLIEVFSYRNDLSQRRSIIEESLALLLHKHKFDIPQHVITRQQEQIINLISTNSDYQVYRMQKDFQERVEQLAEKQVKEALILDQLAYNDNLIPSDLDVKSYLNLTKRPRAKEFIYFDAPITRVHGKESPICAEELRHICMREKTLNHVIHHLMRA